MPRFVVLLATGLSAAILYNVARAVLEGTLDPVVVPLVAGLVAWSSIIVAITLPLAERVFRSVRGWTGKSAPRSAWSWPFSTVRGSGACRADITRSSSPPSWQFPSWR